MLSITFSSVRLPVLFAVGGLFLTAAGCAGPPTIAKSATPSPEQQAQVAARKQRLEELRRQYPKVPESALATIMDRPGTNPGGPPR